MVFPLAKLLKKIVFQQSFCRPTRRILEFCFSYRHFLNRNEPARGWDSGKKNNPPKIGVQSCFLWKKLSNCVYLLWWKEDVASSRVWANVGFTCKTRSKRDGGTPKTRYVLMFIYIYIYEHVVVHFLGSRYHIYIIDGMVKRFEWTPFRTDCLLQNLLGRSKSM